MSTRPVRLLLLTVLAVVAIGSLAACSPRTSVVSAAKSAIGARYRSGGTSPSSGLDCSGLTRYAWQHGGVDLPHSSSAQYQATERITRAELQPGDLVFYGSGGRSSGVSHVALYEGNGKIVQATHYGQGANEYDLATWWTGHLVAFGRVKAA